VTQPPAPDRAPSAGVLEARTAGDKVIRGSALRTGGYMLGMALAAGASVFLLRHLGVVDFGRYVTVMSLVAIVGGLTDAGLTVVGQREYALLGTAEKQRRLLSGIVGIRLVLTPFGVLVAALFAVVADYGQTMVLGTLVAGAGMVLINVAATLTLPLSVELRLGTLTVTEVVKQAAITGGIVILVALGAGLFAFFTVQPVAGVIALVVTVALVGPAASAPPHFELREWLPLLKEAWPVAVSLAVNVLYLRVLVVMISLLGTAVETGLFATSYRIVEIFLGIPVLMLGAAFPLLAHAGESDESRLAYALQRMGEVALLIAVALVLVLAVAADPIVELLGGDQYADAGSVLRIQCFALIGAFMTQTWVLGLVAVRRQRALIVTNAIALGTVLALGFALIPPLDAEGAALAAAIGEGALAVATLVMLVRARPALRPNLLYAVKLAAAGAVGAGAAVVSGVPDAAAAVLASAVYLALAWVTRAVPVELLRALVRRSEVPA
jgi:O-antigen/teichoic acid export membrane protein